MIEQELAQKRIDPRDRFPTLLFAIEDVRPGARAVVEQRRAQLPVLRIPPGAYPFRRRAWGVELPFGWRRTPERILLFDPHRITVIETDWSGQTVVTDIPLAALIEIHQVTILLYSYLELLWVDGSHVEIKRIEYNSVGEHFIEDQVRRVRALHPPCLSPAEVQDREAIMAPLPYKFRNYLRSSLLSDEHLIAAVFQPALRRSVGPLRPYFAPNRALSVTERCLIVIEDRRHGRLAETDYAILHYFYPLSYLQNITVETTPDVGWLHLQQGTAGGVQQTDIPLMPDQLDVLRGVLSVNRV